MTFGIIGFIVGLVMGLTGAGGALISIPLFLGLIGSSLKEATVLSLLSVILGTAVNLWGKLDRVDRRITLTFSLFGVASSAFAKGWKESLPDAVVALLLLLIAIYSLWSVWRGRSESSDALRAPLWHLILTGLFLGVVTTFTGLGGGVLLVPILMKVFGRTYEEALPTSLGSILLISLGAFTLQFGSVSGVLGAKDIGMMFIGSLASFFALNLALKLLSPKTSLLLRKVVFSGVTVYAVASVFFKTFGAKI